MKKLFFSVTSKVVISLLFFLFFLFIFLAYEIEKKYEEKISSQLNTYYKYAESFLNSQNNNQNLFLIDRILQENALQILNKKVTCNQNLNDLSCINFQNNINLLQNKNIVDIAIFNELGQRIFLQNFAKTNFTPETLLPKPKENTANFLPLSQNSLYKGKTGTAPFGYNVFALEIYSENVYKGSLSFIEKQDGYNFFDNDNSEIKFYGVDKTGAFISLSSSNLKKEVSNKIIEACRKNDNEIFQVEKTPTKTTFAKVSFKENLNFCLVAEMSSQQGLFFGSFLYSLFFITIILILLFIILILHFTLGKVIKSIKQIYTIGESFLIDFKVKEFSQSNILEIDNLAKIFNFILNKYNKDLKEDYGEDLLNKNILTREKDVTKEVLLKMKKFKEAVDSASDIIMLLSLEGYITYANNSLQKISGFSFEEVEGKKPTEIWHTKDTETLFKNSFNKILESRENAIFSCIANKKNGENYESEIRISPIIDQNSGKINTFLVMERDVSDDRQKERMKNEFISVVSHELRTPMTVIRGYSSLLFEGKVGELNQKQKEFIERINSETTRLLDMANDMLDLQKFEAGKAQMHLEKVEMSSFVKNIQQEFEPLFNKKGLYLNFENHANSSFALIDKRYIERSIINLINNSMKFTEKGGISIFLVNPDEKHIVIAIKDTGVGIPNDAIPHLFNKFYQASNVFDRKQDGSGLGLSIVKRIVEAHKGVVWAESKEGFGATFFIALPL